MEAEKCFCGSDVCVCRLDDDCGWRVHCMTCDWGYGGSSLPECESKDAVIKEWNDKVRKYNERK